MRTHPTTTNPSTAPTTRPTTPPTTRPTNTSAAGPEPDADRRRLLRHLGLGAGALAGGAMLAAAQAGPAGADNGDHLVMGSHGGSSNSASATTEVRSSARTGTMGLFVVQDGTLAFTFFPAAVQGLATDGVVSSGVFGYSSVDGGYGVVGVGPEAGVYASGTRADLALNPAGPAPYAGNVEHGEGDIVADGNADIWACVANGTPGTFRKVAGPATAGSLHMLTAPVRVYDSRPGNAPDLGTKTPLANGAIRDIDAKGNGSGVPDRATAILANFTVVNTSATGYLSAYRSGIANPGTSTINWNQPGTIVANTTVVAISSAETFRCYVPPTSSTDFFVDVLGYYL